MNQTITKSELASGLKVIAAIGSAVQEAGAIPSGTLYATVMGQLSMEAYNKIINILKNAKLVEEDVSHMLRWVGPAKEVAK